MLQNAAHNEIMAAFCENAMHCRIFAFFFTIKAAADIIRAIEKAFEENQNGKIH